MEATKCELVVAVTESPAKVGEGSSVGTPPPVEATKDELVATVSDSVVLLEVVELDTPVPLREVKFEGCLNPSPSGPGLRVDALAELEAASGEVETTLEVAAAVGETSLLGAGRFEGPC